MLRLMPNPPLEGAVPGVADDAGDALPRAEGDPAPGLVPLPPPSGRGSWTLDRVGRFLSTAMKHDLQGILGTSEVEDGWVPIELLSHHLIVVNWGDMQYDTHDDVLSLIARAVKSDAARFAVDSPACQFVKYIWREERHKGRGKGKRKRQATKVGLQRQRQRQQEDQLGTAASALAWSG